MNFYIAENKSSVYIFVNKRNFKSFLHYCKNNHSNNLFSYELTDEKPICFKEKNVFFPVITPSMKVARENLKRIKLLKRRQQCMEAIQKLINKRKEESRLKVIQSNETDCKTVQELVKEVIKGETNE